MTPKPFLGIKPKQAVIIAILAGVLGYLFLGQNDGNVEESAGDANATNQAAGTGQTSNAATPPAFVPRWPEVDLDRALSNNPFAALAIVEDADSTPAVPTEVVESLPAAAPDAEAPDNQDSEAEADAVAAFQSLGVSLIFRNREKTCALIGDRVVKEGDIIDGVRVVAITATEVIVEPANKRSN